MKTIKQTILFLFFVAAWVAFCLSYGKAIPVSNAINALIAFSSFVLAAVSAIKFLNSKIS